MPTLSNMIGNSKKVLWTKHSEAKMRQYGLSKTKILKILQKPERKEKGIIPGTTALMATNKKHGNKAKPLFGKNWQFKKVPGEIWMMYKDVKDLRKIISAWRYPGISKPGEQIPVPEDIRQELLNELQ